MVDRAMGARVGAAVPVVTAVQGGRRAPSRPSDWASSAKSAPPKTTVPPLAVSPRKAATYLDVGHDAIYQLLNQGRIRSVKLGRRRLIPVSELERFLVEELA